ncbi:uncharacterized protein BJ171DRAFT_481609 [Polychytrium aggregatum]|uniref:uncharacterized protein n=1 Tax=Polychytrium aggregatum TaxID=110093 RepID=UPI0022FEDFEB|nr:uncharacterized protein BJ171DRAFT_481609 [Polychytrium aggregatum]KAI9190825.1 hypothetical protein BJ171DRAFT_481609 [Polychytrium aggregatum]
MASWRDGGMAGERGGAIARWREERRYFLIIIITSLIVIAGQYLSQRAISQTSGKSIVMPSPALDWNSTPQKHFIGIFTDAKSYARRALIRMGYLHIYPKPWVNLELYFVICEKPTSPMMSKLLKLEQFTHRDLLLLDCTENMDEGKTHTYFSYMGSGKGPQGFNYATVMKLDTDAIIHLPRYIERIEGLPKKSIYYGLPQIGFEDYVYMGGYAYTLSMDLCIWIAQSEFAANNTIGFEDRKLATWLLHYNATSNPGELNMVGESESRMWTEFPDPLVNVPPDIIVLHRAKSDEKFITGSFLMLGQVLNPGLADDLL